MDDAAPPALAKQAASWATWAASAAVVAFLAHAVNGLGWAAVRDVLPANPIFYLLLFAAYLALPLSEALIFRRVWNVGWGVLEPLVRKRVLNDAVMGYAGEAWLFVWARSQAGLRERALAAVKDVSITSALAGNLATVVMLGVSLAVAGGGVAGLIDAETLRAGALGVSLVMAASIAVLLLRGKVLSLSGAENRFAFAVACARLAVAGLLVLIGWWIALPAVAIGTWLLLGALRLVVTRLPLVPNKELLFTVLAVALAGPTQPAVAALLAATAACTLVFHASVFAGASFWRWTR